MTEKLLEWVAALAQFEKSNQWALALAVTVGVLGVLFYAGAWIRALLLSTRDMETILFVVSGMVFAHIGAYMLHSYGSIFLADAVLIFFGCVMIKLGSICEERNLKRYYAPYRDKK